MGSYEALLWLCEWNLGEQRGKRAKGEQTGSLNSLFHRFEAFFKDLGPFQRFGAFSGIRGLFRGFAAFLRICGLFVDLRPFRRFVAFSQTRGLFADSRPFHRFADSWPRERRERTSHLAKLSLPDICLHVPILSPSPSPSSFIIVLMVMSCLMGRMGVEPILPNR